MLSERRKMQRAIASSVILVGIVMALALLTSVARAQVTQSEDGGGFTPDAAKWAFLAAAISVGLGSMGAGIAVAYVGAAAVGAVAEKPQLAGRALIFVGLAEGIAIYGLIVAIMILGKV